VPNAEEAYVSLIKIAWDDIHHSRNQDWKFWVVLAGIAAGLIGLGGRTENWPVIGCLLATGSILSGIAALISWNHWELLCKKTAWIEWLETLLARCLGPQVQRGLPYHGTFRSRFPDRWSVSGVIFSVYVMLALDFLLGLLVLLTWPGTVGECSRAAGALFGLVALGISGVVLFVSYGCSTSRMSKKRRTYRAHFENG